MNKILDTNLENKVVGSIELDKSIFAMYNNDIIYSTLSPLLRLYDATGDI